MAPTPDVAIAHVRRVALDADGKPIPIDDASAFSEMAMYVLVRRDGQMVACRGPEHSDSSEAIDVCRFAPERRALVRERAAMPRSHIPVRHSSLYLPTRQRRPSNAVSHSLANAVATAGPWFTAVRGLVRGPRPRRGRHIRRRVDGARGLAGRSGRHRGPCVRVASVSAGQGADRGAHAAQRRDVHGAQRQRLASRRARRQELRPHPGVRHPIRIRQSADRRQVREPPTTTATSTSRR